MPIFSADQLRILVNEIFVKKGASSKNASIVAELLIKSNLAGHDSHGIFRVPAYVEAIDKGKLNPLAEATVEVDDASVGLVNGNAGFGQVIATQAMQLAISKGKKYGVSAISIHNCGHIGRMADYSMMALDENMIGITMVNSDPAMAPFGGVERMFNPSPLGCAIPTAKNLPFILDISMSVCAAGKVFVKKARNENLPPGWIIDKDGKPSTNPDDFVNGGSILPIGGSVGYKGYGLAFLIDILSGALSGNGCASSEEFQGGNGVFMLTLDISRLLPVDTFKRRVDDLIDNVKASKKAPGVKEIQIPGEPEFIEEQRRQKAGIFVEDSTWDQVSTLARDLDVEVPHPKLQQ